MPQPLFCTTAVSALDAPQGPSRLCGESVTHARGEVGRKHGEHKPFDFKTNVEQLSPEHEPFQAPALSACLLLTGEYVPPEKEMPETRVGAETSTLCALLDGISNILGLNTACFLACFFLCFRSWEIK